MNASVYVEDILLNYNVPYMAFVTADSLSMQGNTHPHVAQ